MLDVKPEILPDDAIVLNRGCGINYLQRRDKIPFGEVPTESWFLREGLSNKIAIDISWSMLEPEEGHFLWDQPEWEGCFQSWLDAGFKVLLKVRGMDTLGTFYNQGTPQWVFDAGARYVDEPIDPYRGSWLLNNIPADSEMPIRYPVYWDPVYIEKASALIEALGKRYNGHPGVESVAIAHTGRWGEMHIADHLPLAPWLAEGYSVKAFLRGHRQLIDYYLAAFPDTPLQQSIGAPSFHDRLEDAAENFNYLADNGIMLKFGGLGKAWHRPSASPWIDDDVRKLLEANRRRTKIVFENLALPAAMEFGLSMGMSYWQRGGEAAGLGVLNIEKEIPIAEKKLYSFLRFFPEEFAQLTIEDEKNIWRRLAQRTGYRLTLRKVFIDWPAPDILRTILRWSNDGSAACYEWLGLRLMLTEPGGCELWSDEQPVESGFPEAGMTMKKSFEWRLPPGINPTGKELWLGFHHLRFNGEMLQLGNGGIINDGMYFIGIFR